MTPWISLGATACALSVAAGAFGAHGLKERLDPTALELWETAARYLMYGGLGLVTLGLLEGRVARPVDPAGWTLVLGTLIFAGTVFLLALGAPRWLGAITPIGGALTIFGFLWFAWLALRGA